MINSQENGLVYIDIYICTHNLQHVNALTALNIKTYIKNYENEVVDIINVFWFEMLIQTLSD